MKWFVMVAGVILAVGAMLEAGAQEKIEGKSWFSVISLAFFCCAVWVAVR